MSFDSGIDYDTFFQPRAPYEAAAKAWHDRQQAGRLGDRRRYGWHEITEHDRHTVRAIVAPIVDAALATMDQEWTWTWTSGPDGPRGYGTACDSIEAVHEENGDYLPLAVRRVTAWELAP